MSHFGTKPLSYTVVRSAFNHRKTPPPLSPSYSVWSRLRFNIFQACVTSATMTLPLERRISSYAFPHVSKIPFLFEPRLLRTEIFLSFGLRQTHWYDASFSTLIKTMGFIQYFSSQFQLLLLHLCFHFSCHLSALRLKWPFRTSNRVISSSNHFSSWTNLILHWCDFTSKFRVTVDHLSGKGLKGEQFQNGKAFSCVLTQILKLHTTYKIYVALLLYLLSLTTGFPTPKPLSSSHMKDPTCLT